MMLLRFRQRWLTRTGFSYKMASAYTVLWNKNSLQLMNKGMLLLCKNSKMFYQLHNSFEHK